MCVCTRMSQQLWVLTEQTLSHALLLILSEQAVFFPSIPVPPLDPSGEPTFSQKISSQSNSDYNPQSWVDRNIKKVMSVACVSQNHSGLDLRD